MATATEPSNRAVNIAVGTDPVDIKAANLTGNSITDLVVANHGTGANSVSVLINNGSGSFTQTQYTAGVGPNSIAIADFNGDGILDIAVANVGFNPDDQSGTSTRSRSCSGTAMERSNRWRFRSAASPCRPVFTLPGPRSGRSPRATSTVTGIPTSWSRTTD